MHQAGAVHGGQRLRERQEQLEDLVDGEGLAVRRARVDAVGEGRPREVLHHHVGHASVLADAEDGHHARVAHRRQRARLAEQELRGEGRVAGHLHRHRALQARVEGLEHRPHSSLAEHGPEYEVAQALAEGEEPDDALGNGSGEDRGFAQDTGGDDTRISGWALARERRVMPASSTSPPRRRESRLRALPLRRDEPSLLRRCARPARGIAA